MNEPSLDEELLEDEPYEDYKDEAVSALNFI